MPIQVGETIPANATFKYIPYSPEIADIAACGVPKDLKAHEEWKGKKVVLVSVPGAFTPTCHVNHLPPFVQKINEFKAKGVDVVAFVAANDVFVMSAWGRSTNAGDKILFLSDTSSAFADAIGTSVDLSHIGFGKRTGRWALIIDDLKVTYVGVEPAPGVTVSGADAIIARL